MVKLTEMTTNTAFYFNTMDDCQKFMYTFKDHWCNVKWNNPQEGDFSKELDHHQKRYIDMDPIKRAENNLSWGFNICGKSLTSEQQRFVNEMVSKLAE